MIYVNKDTINVEIPKSGNTGEARQIRLLNLLTNIDIYAEIEDLGNDPIVYIFNIESIVKDLVVGLYDYFVLDENGSVLDNGILQYDSFNSEVGAYSLDDPKMIQYSLGGAYTPIPETIFTIFENGVYDTIGIDKVIVKVQCDESDEPDEPVDYPNYLVFTNTNQVTINNNLNSAPNLEYSFDRDNWVTIEFPQDTSILDIATDDKPIYFRGDNPDGFDNNVLGNKFLTFVSDGEVGGNIMSLLDPTCESVALPNNYYCFGRLFYSSRITSAANLILPADLLVSNTYYALFANCVNLTQAPVLPATKLAMLCYMSMFDNCKSLTKAPVLPAATLAPYCYQYMFRGCITLVNPPELPAMNLAENCYNGMFSGCTALRTVPNLPATTLVSGCYSQMFTDCVCLTSDDLPELPLLTLADGCYSFMFSGCVGLTTAPELPAKIATRNCYRYMFSGCTSLTTAPELPATTVEDNCYEGMFSGCIGLSTTPELPATTLASTCYASMFEGCTALTAAPELPATTLASYCYQKMFFGCTSLTKAPSKIAATAAPSYCCYLMFLGCAALNTTPELPATKLNWLSYDSMFRDCTSLTTTPELPATTLASYCYSNMFSGCTSLTTAPELPATTLASYCYSNMFYYCSSLTDAPELPAETLANSCYEFMFYYCSSLTDAPELPAETLANSCYEFMFHNCSSLTTAIVLPAETLATECYKLMFSGCSRLTSITCLATNISASSALTGWTYGVASTGTFTKAAGVEWPTGTSGIPSGWSVKIDGQYTITFANWDGTVLQTIYVDEGQTPVYTGSTPTRPSDEQYDYTFNGWTPAITAAIQDVTYTALYTATEIPVEPQVPNYVTFTAEEADSTIGVVKLGSVHTLEYSTDTQSWTPMTTETSVTLTNVTDKVYVRGILNDNLTNSDYTLFTMSGKIAASGNCNALWNYEDLNAPLKNRCGYNMFNNCTSLTQAPELPATALADYCYFQMFAGCTSLTAAPELPAIRLVNYCYYGMFNNCASLTTAPELPATTLAEHCYHNMFSRCASLTQAPALPAKTLVKHCYYSMFSSCTSLTAAPELPAIRLVNYCYYWMFYNCANLNYIKCLATSISANDALTGWTYGVSSTGTFYKAASITWPTGTAGIPSGWTVVEV